MTDWRLQGQEKHMTGLSLRFEKYTPDAGDDHDHCEFCCEKFANFGDNLRQGYTTDDNLRWVCEAPARHDEG